MKKKYFLPLPSEILAKIVMYCGIQNIKKLSRHRSVYSLLNQNAEIWNNFSKTSCLSIEGCKNILKNRSTLIKHIKQKNEKVLTFLTGQADMTQLSFLNNRIYVSSDDHTVRAFDHYGSCEKKFVGHSGGIWTFDFLNNRLVTGSVDRTAKIWDAETDNAFRTLKYHRSTIRALKAHQGYIITGSRDHTIAVWNSHGDILYRLEGHSDSVRVLDINDEYLVSGSYDGTCKLWDYKRGKFLRDLHKHEKRIYCLKMYGDYVASAGIGSKVQVSKIDGSFNISYSIHQGCVGWIFFEERYVISISNDGCIVKYDYINKELVYKINLSSTIRDAKVTDSLILIAANNEAIVYSLSTGCHIRTLMKSVNVSKIDMIDWKIVVGYSQNNIFKLSIFEFNYSY